MLQDDIRAIWSRHLKLAPSEVGDDDDFFNLGGHSLIMASIQDDFSDKYGVDVAMDDLFRRPTIRQIAGHLESMISVA